MSVTVSQTHIPGGSQVTLKIEITTHMNTTSYVAKQRVNRFLAVNAGNMLAAGEPELVVGERLLWRVPVMFGTPEKGQIGKVGELQVNVESGDVIVDDSTQVEVMLRNAEILYSGSSLPAGA
jgi:hypothetical protein